MQTVEWQNLKKKMNVSDWLNPSARHPPQQKTYIYFLKIAYCTSSTDSLAGKGLKASDKLLRETVSTVIRSGVLTWPAAVVIQSKFTVLIGCCLDDHIRSAAALCAQSGRQGINVMLCFDSQW